MTLRQRFLKWVYPIWMWWGRVSGLNNLILTGDKPPPVSFYELKSTLNNGQPFDFSSLKGKSVLLVNTASNCGYTRQYDELEKLSQQYKEILVVLAFPSNDFKRQENLSDAEIGNFCRTNYGISFPLMKKISVLRSENPHPVFLWLTDPGKNDGIKNSLPGIFANTL